MENKPTIFIASTVYDFADLRSALKPWLEEQGYEVLLSDTNDFPVNRSQSSYQACLDAISRCNYFILLIGSRVGGLFDAQNQISITRQEYREAYKLAQQGKLKMVTFVRKIVWDYKHSQKELETFLRQEFCIRKEVTEDDIKKIMNRPSDFANQATVTMSFIDEVAKVGEMKNAISNQGGAVPTANWLHIFSTFQEIVDCLKIEFAVDDTKRKRLIYLLEKEICENLSEILIWDEKKKQVLELCSDGDILRDKMQGNSKSISDMDAEELADRFFNNWIYSYTCNKMSTRYISQSIDSGLFLKYEKEHGRYEQTKLSHALWLLGKEIHFLQQLMENPGKDIYKKYYEMKVHGNQQIQILNKDLGILLSISDRRYNIIHLSKAILRDINGNADILEQFIPKPFSPFKDVEEDRQKECPDEKQIRTWALG
jgi:hypothetical protein